MPARYHLVWTRTFSRTARKFLKRHPDLKGIFQDVLEQLEDDPQAARLRLHALGGHHKGKHAVSLTYFCRIVFILVISDREIILLDIGDHDSVYR